MPLSSNVSSMQDAVRARDVRIHERVNRCSGRHDFEIERRREVKERNGVVKSKREKKNLKQSDRALIYE